MKQLTVGELIKRLQQCNPNAQSFVSVRDAFGSHFDPIVQVVEDVDEITGNTEVIIYPTNEDKQT